MLYDRWRQIVHQFQDATALIDATAGRRWTFQQLDRAAESSASNGASAAFPRGMAPTFIFEVLGAWKRGTVVCPLEDGQAPVHLDKLPDGCFHLKTTSATTGAPRLIAFTADQLAADASNIVATMGLRHDWPNLGVISLAHSYGFSNLVLPLLLHGIPLILADSPLPETVRRAAAYAQAITLPAVPALWRAWFESKAIPPNVRLAISAGAPLALALERQAFGHCGLKIHNFYGASECGGIAFDPTNVPRTDAAYVGAPLRAVEVSVDQEGCLSVRSPAAGLTYWPEPSSSLGDGCYHTTDLADIQKGQVFLRGRQADQINVAGRKVSPETIESVLASHPAVRECLVFGIPSADDRVETIVACVNAAPGTTSDALKHHLLEVLPAWQVPRHWWFVPDLTVNQRGKLARAEWRERYLNEECRRKYEA